MPRLRHVLLPAEHGSWAFLVMPLAVGVCAGRRWTVASLYLVVAALAAFLVRQPVMRLVKVATGRAPRAESRAHLVWIALLALVGGGHVAGLVLRGFAHVLWLAVPAVPVLAVWLWLVARRQERRQVAIEILGAGALALSAPAAAWVGWGTPDPLGWVLFGLVWGHTAFMVVLAHLRLTQREWPGVPPLVERLRAGRPALLLAGAELVAALGLAAAAIVPRGTIAPYLLQAGVAAWSTLDPAVAWMPRRIGWHLMAVVLAFTLTFLATW
jgi:hypothetical protein